MNQPPIIAANAAPTGVTPSGQRTYLAENAITAKHLFGKQGTAANEIDLAGNSVTDTGSRPLGVITDEGAADEPVNVALLGATGSTMMVTAGLAISPGDLLTSDGSSTARPLAERVPGTYYIAGIALTAAAAGELVEFLPTPGLEVTL